jgi:hypothetical protein
MIIAANTSRMDGEVKEAHMFFRNMILQEIVVRREAMVATLAVVASVKASARVLMIASATKFGTTLASTTTSAMATITSASGGQAYIVVLDKADPPSTSGTNPFFKVYLYLSFVIF